MIPVFDNFKHSYFFKGCRVFSDIPDFTKAEAKNYFDFVTANVDGLTPVEIVVELADDGKVDLHWLAKGEPFHRLRRITGYLTADLRSWNDAKQAEERDRLKHGGI